MLDSKQGRLYLTMLWSILRIRELRHNEADSCPPSVSLAVAPQTMAQCTVHGCEERLCENRNKPPTVVTANLQRLVSKRDMEGYCT
jgi:hypothetical protein